MKPPNQKHAPGKPLDVLHGFSCCNAGYTLTERGNIRLHSKMYGEQLVDYIQPHEFAEMIHGYIKQSIKNRSK